jgi:hypothetical protein
MGFWK